MARKKTSRKIRKRELEKKIERFEGLAWRHLGQWNFGMAIGYYNKAQELKA